MKALKGVICERELYTITELKSRLGLTDSAWWAMKDRGAPRICIGKRVYVSGRQIIRFLEEAMTHGSESVRGQGRREESSAPLAGAVHRPMEAEVGQDG